MSSSLIPQKWLPHKTYIFLGLTTILLLLAFSAFLFGPNLFLFKDIGSDTLNVFYPQLHHVADYLQKEGLPTWSFQQGMGQNILPLSLGDPFQWPLYLLGPKQLAYGIAWMEALKLLLAAFFFFRFLGYRQLAPLAQMAGGLAFAFSGFLLIGAGWYVFSTQAVFMALCLWGFERLLAKQKGETFGLSVFFLALNMPVDLYIIGLFVGVYSVFRLLELGEKDKKAIIQLYLWLMIWGAAGLLMSSVLLISTIDQILNSPRVGGESAFFAQLMQEGLGSTQKAEALTILGRLFSPNFFFGAAYEQLPNGQNVLAYKGWNNYLEAPSLYIALPLLLLLPQALFFQKGKQRYLSLAALILLLLPLFIPFFRYSIWLYAGNYYRIYSLFVATGLLLLALKGLSKLLQGAKPNIWLLIFSLVFWAALLYVPFLSAKEVEVDQSLQNLLFIFLLGGALAIAALAVEKYRLQAFGFLALLFLAELIFSAKQVYSSDRQMISKEEWSKNIGYQDESMAALAKIEAQDSGFYRIEKMYSSSPAMHNGLNDAKVQNFKGSSSYHSFNQKNYIRFLAKTAVIDPKDENQTRWGPGIRQRPLLQVLASSKYWLAKEPLNPFFYVLQDSVGAVKIWKNSMFLPLGFAYDTKCSEKHWEALPKDNQSIRQQMALLKTLVLAQEDLGAFAALQDNPLTDLNPQAYGPNELGQDVANRSRQVVRWSKLGQKHLQGEIALEQPAALFLSIPFDPNWQLLVNGEAQPIYRAQLGFMALPLPAGQHQIELQFSPPYWQPALLGSLLGFLIFGGLLFWQRKR